MNDKPIIIEYDREASERSRMTPKQAQSFMDNPEVKILFALAGENYSVLHAMKQNATEEEWRTLMLSLPRWERYRVHKHTNHINHKA